MNGTQLYGDMNIKYFKIGDRKNYNGKIQALKPQN